MRESRSLGHLVCVVVAIAGVTATVAAPPPPQNAPKPQPPNQPAPPAEQRRRPDVVIGLPPGPGPVVPPGPGPVVPPPVVVVPPPRPFPLVPPPVVLVPPPSPVPVVTTTIVTPVRTTVTAVAETQTVWITNANGSRTSVVLKAADGGMWVGPKGEYYGQIPTEAQLLPVYGIASTVTEGTAAAAVEQPKTVWITNANGSKTSVELKPAGGGMWKGPKGEVYDKLPTEDQLRGAYGL